MLGWAEPSALMGMQTTPLPNYLSEQGAMIATAQLRKWGCVLTYVCLGVLSLSVGWVCGLVGLRVLAKVDYSPWVKKH